MLDLIFYYKAYAYNLVISHVTFLCYREIWKMIEGGADLEVQEGLKATEVEAEVSYIIYVKYYRNTSCILVVPNLNN